MLLAASLKLGLIDAAPRREQECLNRCLTNRRHFANRRRLARRLANRRCLANRCLCLCLFSRRRWAATMRQ
jgi:hypothetical protein